MAPLRWPRVRFVALAKLAAELGEQLGPRLMARCDGQPRRWPNMAFKRAERDQARPDESDTNGCKLRKLASWGYATHRHRRRRRHCSACYHLGRAGGASGEPRTCQQLASSMKACCCRQSSSLSLHLQQPAPPIGPESGSGSGSGIATGLAKQDPSALSTRTLLGRKLAAANQKSAAKKAKKPQNNNNNNINNNSADKKTDQQNKKQTSQQQGRQLDLSHKKLSQIPAAIYSFSNEKLLDELSLESNSIQELPRNMFAHVRHLKRLVVADNELRAIPPQISLLGQLELLDAAKNQMLQLPDELKRCRQLKWLDVSVNPLARLPDSLGQLARLEELYLNDVYIEALPNSIGRLSELRVLELRENELKSLPKSISRLTKLSRLDLGQNQFTLVPEILASCHSLLELWLDSNRIHVLPEYLGKLKQLEYLDLSKNQLELIEPDFCAPNSALHDLLLSYNQLEHLPPTISNLNQLAALKVDCNKLIELPQTLGSLHLLEELVFINNRVRSIPSSVGQLTRLKLLLADFNCLARLPNTIGQCKSLRIFTLASNNLLQVPEEIGQLTELRVLNLANNYLRHLPKSVDNLTNLSALWLNDNQKKPKLTFDTELEPRSKQHVLTCQLFPQTGPVLGQVSSAAVAAAVMSAAASTLGEQPMALGPADIEPLVADELEDTEDSQAPRTGPQQQVSSDSIGQPAASNQQQQQEQQHQSAPSTRARPAASRVVRDAVGQSPSGARVQSPGRQANGVHAFGPSSTAHLHHPTAVLATPSSRLMTDEDDDAGGINLLQISNTLDSSKLVATDTSAGVRHQLVANHQHQLRQHPARVNSQLQQQQQQQQQLLQN